MKFNDLVACTGIRQTSGDSVSTSTIRQTSAESGEHFLPWEPDSGVSVNDDLAMLLEPAEAPR